MKVRIETELECSADVAWQALLKRDTFLHITRGMLGFGNANQWPEIYSEGTEIHTRLWFFHFIPGWQHHLRIARIDPGQRELLSKENGGLVKKWNHRIRIAGVGADRCRYVDEIEIEAGWMTRVVGVFANIFYRYRQRRWRALARRLAMSSTNDRVGKR